MADAWEPVLAAQCAVLALGLVRVLAVLRTSARTVGPPLRVARAGRAGRLGASAVLAAALATTLVAATPSPWVLAALGLAAVVTWVRPHPEDALAGRDGVRCGWTSLAFRDVEEWRLAGKHLRVRGGRGGWIAQEVPPELVGELEARLREVAPERESPFK